MRLISVLLAVTVLSSPVEAQSTPPRWGNVAGVHAGSPAIVSVAVGVSRFLGRAQADPDHGSAVFALLEPGIGAGRVSLGYGYVWGNLGTFWTVRATALRRWRDAAANYVGGEVSVQVLGLGPRIGVFRPLDASVERNTRITIDFGFGF